MMAKSKGERRWEECGEFRLMAEAEGHVLFRRVGCAPCVCSRKEWDLRARTPEEVRDPIGRPMVKHEQAPA